MNYSLSAYGANPHAGRNPNTDNGWGPYKWPGGVPVGLRGTANYKAISVTVRRELIPLFEAMFELTGLLGYQIWTSNPNGSGEFWGPWSYENRAITGTQQASNHSRARAIDINAPYNPQSRTFTSNIPPAVVSAWERCGFFWGGRYSGGTKYDPMHFEFVMTPADVPACLELARSMIRAFGVVIPEKPSEPTEPTKPADPPADNGGWPLPAGHWFGPKSGPANCHSGFSDTGDTQAMRNAIADFQGRLNSLGYTAGTPDGLWGEKTSAAVLEWQKRNLGGPRQIQTSGLCGSNDFFAIREAVYQNRMTVAAPPYPGTLLQLGSKGENVRTAQARLNVHLIGSAMAPITVDGDFGNGTRGAVVWFQTCRNLDPDGIIGANTWESLWH